ncbi:cytoplasmic protein [Mammaliicoccus sciuri]|uniref:cytoplasmic protein n=1 Tax=Mammaliicoccus sciuri TaxID=1296 RepID=UPI001E622234|nr:cytoplasmic protein [Mammaliicoccus sciuri]MCD8898510.1 cytoplasmic protein [Mammaliicoccus sciuri]
MTKKVNLSNNLYLVIFGSDENSFMVTSTLIVSENKALLVGAKFTRNDAKEIVDYLENNQLILEKVFVIHGDPDYYFGLDTIKKSFPHALAIATQPTIHHILESVEDKLAFWKETLNDQAPDNIIIPQVISDDYIEFGGVNWELIGSEPSRINLWDETSKTLIGGIDTFNEIHLFLADINTIEGQKLWVSRIDKLLDLDPIVIVPSHADLSKSFDKSALVYTKDYLIKAIDTLEKTIKSDDFKNVLASAYPNARNTGVLELSSKVVTKEIPWGE